jgi:hypothetical protein
MEEITIKDVGDKAVEAIQGRDKDPKSDVNENSANNDDNKAVLDTAVTKDSTLSYKPTPFGIFILISYNI